MKQLFFSTLFLSTLSLLAQPTAIVTSEFIFENAPFPECHASTIIATPEGLVAAWFGGTEEKNKDVEVWLSRNTNGKWTTPVSVANGIQNKRKRYPCWNPVLFQIPEGDLMLFYKVGPSPREWWGELKTSKDGGKTWSKSTRLPRGVLGPIKNKPVLLDNGELICPSSSEHDGWRVHFEFTKNWGKTWELIEPINDGKEYSIIQPSVLTYPDGRLQILCRSQNNRIISSWSTDKGKTWSELTPTELPNPNSGTDAVTLNNGWQLLVYNHSEKEEGEWGGPRTPLNVAISKDGSHWKTVLTLEDEAGEYSYPAVIQDAEGRVHITYTYNRKRVKYVQLDAAKLVE